MAVARKARKDGIDVAVRIGVHTGRVTGGIIGTLRFHFDMWGAGVNGAVRMEEAGERSRVHVSGVRTCVHVFPRPRVTDSTAGPCPRVTDATAELVRHRFECKQGMVEGELGAAEFELGIRSTWYVP